MNLKKVISGGQTGVDRAALDAAMDADITTGGYCAQGRKAEGGIIPAKYPLVELDSPESYYRTEKNVIESDGTLILNKGNMTGGTKLTDHYTVKYDKPKLIIQIDADIIADPINVVRWLIAQNISVLNVAGPRESRFREGIYKEAYRYLNRVFSMLKEI